MNLLAFSPETGAGAISLPTTLLALVVFFFPWSFGLLFFPGWWGVVLC